jgi:hypothetical protein
MPTHDPLFDSAWFKWAQGVVHAQTLQNAIINSVGADAEPLVAARTEYHAKRHGFVVVATEVAAIPMRWRLLLGDVANDYRAALDHLAWALVLRGSTPPGSGKLTLAQENAVYFPICQNRTEFNAEIRVPPKPKSRLKLPGVRRADSAIARRRQPYHYGPVFRSRHVLTLLAAVNNGDKHRAVQPLWAHPSSVGTEILGAWDCVAPKTAQRNYVGKGRPLEPGAEIAYIRTRKSGPNPQMKVKLSIAAQPSLDNRLGCPSGCLGAPDSSRLSSMNSPSRPHTSERSNPAARSSACLPCPQHSTPNEGIVALVGHAERERG